MTLVQRLLCAALVVMMSAFSTRAQAPAEPLVVIHAGALIDRPGDAPRGPSTIIVRETRIEAIRDAYIAPPAGARLIDLKKEFVLPGLINAHVHIFSDDDNIATCQEA